MIKISFPDLILNKKYIIDRKVIKKYYEYIRRQHSVIYAILILTSSYSSFIVFSISRNYLFIARLRITLLSRRCIITH